MTTGTSAACLPTLKPLLATISAFFTNLTTPTRHRSHTPKADPPAQSPPPSPYLQSYSTPTFLSLPRPKPSRYHDHASDLDFDLYDAPARSRTHSRNPSNMTIFSNFTTHVEHDVTRPGSRSRAGFIELEEEDKRGFRGGYAVSITHGGGERYEGIGEGRTIRRVASDEESVGRWGEGKGEEAGGRILRTTEVTVSGARSSIVIVR